MTIQKTTDSHIVFDKSMKVAESQSCNDVESTSIFVSEELIAGIGPYKKSKTGKLPRIVHRAQAEAKNTELRSSMQEARAELAREFFDSKTNTLAKLRLERGYSQQQLARLLGTSQPHVANIEAGKIDPQFETVTRLVDALGITMNDIRPLLEHARRIHKNDN